MDALMPVARLVFASPAFGMGVQKLGLVCVSDLTSASYWARREPLGWRGISAERITSGVAWAISEVVNLGLLESQQSVSYCPLFADFVQNAFMSHAHHAFVQAASALPCWLAPTRFASSQFRPVDLPIFRPHQLTIEDAVGSGLDSGAALSGKSPLEPAVDNGAGNAKQPGKGALSTQGENCVVEVGFGLHDDIVRCMSSECQQEVAPTVQKLGMDVWRHIEEELHRRRLNAAWLGRKLHFFGNICIHALSVAHV